MRKLTITIEISDKTFDLLKRLETEGGWTEFRDSEYDSFEEFKKGSLYGTPTPNPLKVRDENWFYSRNFCDLNDLQEAINAELVDIRDMSWNLTYELTNKGKQMLKENK